MISGLDTTFLVQAEVREHPGHEAARGMLVRSIEEGLALAIAPQVLCEFIHIVTDERRFEKPLPMNNAIDRATAWWEAKETVQVFPNAETMRLFSAWMTRFALGRKRILDTLLAATYLSNDISSVMTSNLRDFHIFEVFEVIVPASSSQRA